MIWQQANLKLDPKKENRAVFRAPGLKNGQERMTIQFGRAQIQTEMLFEEGEVPTLILGRRIVRKLQLPARERIGFYFCEDSDQLILGPLFAILTTSGGKDEALFGKRTGTCREILNIAEERGMVGVVLTEKSQIGPAQAQGYLMRSKRWQERSLPLPRVTYDRLATRSSVSKHKMLKAARWLRSGYYFNPEYLDKWQTYVQITQEEACYGWPLTRLLTARNLMQMLKQFDLVYMKPAASSLGQGIMSISRQNGRWLLQHHVAHGKTRRYSSSKLSRLWPVIAQATKGKRYIVQQGIRLMKHRGASFDVRVLVQKDGEAQWQVMGMGARVASQNGIVTHVPNGGHRLSLEKVLPPDRCAEISEAIAQLVLDAAERLQASSPKLWAELSYDVGVDEQGNPWIIEINSHPFRFDERHIRLNARQTLLDYICALSAGQGDRCLELKG